MMARRKASAGSKAGSYLPLLGMVLVLVLVLLVLPSSLNQPQANPATTLEYAPVPPDSDTAPPPGGDLSSLGLGSSDTIAAPAPGPGRGGGLGTGERPSTKLCVGNPPRQTEDPLSPPCVAYFEGDNGGATYDGVTGTEVRVVAYVEGNFQRVTGEGRETAPSERCFDLGKPPADDEDVYQRVLRALQSYFNTRYQTYGRRVLFHVCYDGNADLPETRRADAAKHINEIDPFAALNIIVQGNPQEYMNAVAARGRVVFSALPTHHDSDLRRYPGLVWNYLPPLERKAASFADYVCTKVVPHPVSFAGNDQDPDTRLHNGQPRRLGLLYVDNPGDPNAPWLTELAEMVRDRVEACGGDFVAEATYPVWGGYFADSNPREAAENMALFKQAGVTTVIWPGGTEGSHSHAAASINYRPEWVLAGDGQMEGYEVGQFQDQTVWRHAWVVTEVTRFGAFEENFCWRAMQEGNPNAYEADAKYACPIGELYEAIRQLFTGIQVAGPRLAPENMDEGFHAIPGHPSSDARVPACFYEAGDYTCVKDATAMWWDPAGPARNGTRGCWRMPQGGKRFLTGDWPNGDVTAQKRAGADPCNGYFASVYGA